MSGPDLRALYVQEAAVQLDRLADGALVLERGEGSEDLVAQLFRDAHNLKSSSGLVGLPVVGDVAHGLEDVLGELRAGRRRPDSGLVTAMLGVIDAMRAMIPLALDGRDADVAAHADAARSALAAVDAPATGPDPEAASSPAPAPPGPAEALLPPDDVPVPGPPPAPAGAPSSSAPAPVEGGATLTVDRDRLDRLVRLAGEAIAQNLRLRHLVGDALLADPEAEATAVALARTLDGLRTQAVATRTTTIGAIAAPLRRAVRDVASARGRDVDYVFSGDDVELDRAVLDGLREPLLHLVRNAADHGVEDPDVRRAAGKDPRGTVGVTARRRGPEIVVEVTDDGAGLDLDALRAAATLPDAEDAQIADLVFRPGVSTAGAVTATSGRGVGLDAVRSAVESLRGRVTVATAAGAGTTFTITVPLTLAVLPCVLVVAAGERYAIPSHATVGLVEDPRAAQVALDGGDALWLGGDVVALATLADLLGSPGPRGDGPAIVLDAGSGTRCALRLDDVAGQRDVTVTEIGDVVPRNPLVAGASIEPDGSIVLVLDPAALVDRAVGARGGSPVPAAAPAPAAPHGPRARVLVVDDALTVRELQRSILERAGYAVRVASDGHEALARLAEERPDIVLTDVEMPGLDGLGLTRAVRANAALASLPVLMVTSRATDADRAAGLEAGADAYLVKQDFDEKQLVAAVERLLGGTG